MSMDALNKTSADRMNALGASIDGIKQVSPEVLANLLKTIPAPRKGCNHSHAAVAREVAQGSKLTQLELPLENRIKLAYRRLQSRARYQKKKKTTYQSLITQFSVVRKSSRPVRESRLPVQSAPRRSTRKSKEKFYEKFKKHDAVLYWPRKVLLHRLVPPVADRESPTGFDQSEMSEEIQTQAGCFPAEFLHYRCDGQSGQIIDCTIRVHACTWTDRVEIPAEVHSNINPELLTHSELGE